MKDKLGGNIMKEFVGLRAKNFVYLIDDGSEDKKQKAQKRRYEMDFEDYKNCLRSNSACK